MHTSAISLIELGAIFFGLGVLGRVAWKIGISPIPFYLLGGLAFGSGGLLPLQGIEEFASLASEIGVILLLLLLGLEYSAAELVTGMRRAWVAGLLDIVLNAAPGAIVALMLGWGPVGALAMAGVTYISSSGIIAKVLGDLGRLGNRETPVVLSILVFEDLAMALYLPILTAVLAGATLLGGLTAIGISLLGIAISGSTAENATRMLEPLRDLFAAMFFVVFGLNTVPSSIPPVLGAALGLAVVTTITKIITGWWAAKRQGIAKMGRARAGAALVARGEFSIVIAGLAVSAGAVDEQLAALATAYVLIMAIFGPLAARFVEPVARFAMTRLRPAAA